VQRKILTGTSILKLTDYIPNTLSSVLDRMPFATLYFAALFSHALPATERILWSIYKWLWQHNDCAITT